MRRRIDKRKGFLLAAGVFALALTGCAVGVDVQTEEGGTSAASEAETESGQEQAELTPEEQVIADYVSGKNAGDMTAEEYLYLAGLYGSREKHLDERNVLEEGFQLLRDESLLTELQKVWVNLEEESEDLLSEGRLMYQDISLPEYRAEAVNLLTDGEWLKAFMPRLYQGSRNYFLSQDGKMTMALRVGYGELGCLEAVIWYPEESGGVTVLRGNADKVTLLTTGLKDGVYDGAFEAWTCEAATGNVLYEKGTFSGGNYIGDYSAKVHMGDAESDIFSLWGHREEFDYQEYLGAFDAEGRTLIRQNGGGISLVGEQGQENYLVYAYNEEAAKGLYLVVDEEDPLTHVFSSGEMGVDEYPSVKTYQPSGELEFLEAQGGQAAEEELQTRVYNGEIQVCLDGIWHNLGPVEQYIQEDPMTDYRESGSAVVADGMSVSGMAKSGRIGLEGITIAEAERVFANGAK